MKWLLRCGVVCLLLTMGELVIASDFKSFQVKTQGGATNDSLSHYLKSGQIIATESSDPINIIYLLLYPKFSPLVHGGLISEEQGEFFVYEAAGDYKISLSSKPPTDSIRGEVRRTPLSSFIQQGRTVSVYTGLSRHPSATQRAITWARSQWKKRVPFDAYFNYQDDSALYCAEFLALALEKGNGRKYSPVQAKKNRSLKVLLNWLKIKDTMIMPLYQLVAPKDWVLTASLDFSKSELNISRLVKYNLFERFTASQKVGNLLYWSSTKVGFRKSVRDFNNLAMAEAKNTHSEASLDRAVEGIANTILGDFPIKRVDKCIMFPETCSR